MSDHVFPQIDRRVALFGLAGAVVLGGVADGVFGKRKFALFSRLFNPFSADRFELPPLAGLTDRFGSPISGFSSAEIADKAVYINIFASWCPHCRDEHAALMEFARSSAKIYGVAAYDEPDQTLAFLREWGNPFARLGVDRQGYLLRALGARGVPASFVLAPAPKLALKVEGPMDAAQMRDKILPKLA